VCDHSLVFDGFERLEEIESENRTRVKISMSKYTYIDRTIYNYIIHIIEIYKRIVWFLGIDRKDSPMILGKSRWWWKSSIGFTIDHEKCSNDNIVNMPAIIIYNSTTSNRSEQNARGGI
jgi:hypothetical protein